MSGVWVRVAKEVGEGDGRERVVIGLRSGVELDHLEKW